MNFLAPGFAFFAVLFAVPIIIHLIGRSRARPRRFAAIELLLRSQRRVARRTRIKQLLLLTLRALAIAAVPLILAKPFVEALSDLPAAVGGAQSAVIVIDDSLSMARTVSGTRLLDEARARARRIVDALPADAEAAVVLASRGGAAPVAELTSDRARVLRAIADVTPTYRATDVTGALKRAAQILQNAARPEKRVYLISDLAQHGFDREAPWAAGAGPELVAVDVGAPGANRAVTDVKVEAAAHLGPRAVRVTVEVANFDAQPVKDLPVTLFVDGKPVAKGLVDVEANARAQKRFFHAFARDDKEAANGVHELAAELPEDALPGDDRRFARVEVRRDVRVLLVDGDPRTVRRQDEVFYLETALRPGDSDESQLDVQVVGPDELDEHRLHDADVVFLCNVKAPQDAGPLRDFVEHGGGLFIAAGENVDPDAYDDALGELLPQPLQAVRTVGAVAGAREDGETRTSGEGEHLGRVESTARAHPLLAPLELGKDADALTAARFGRYLLLKPVPESEGRNTLLRLESGAPALVERTLGAGRVMLFVATLDRDWDDLAIQPIFLPLVQQAARYLARAPLSEPEPPALVGQRHDIPIPDGTQRVEVTAPSGRTRLYERDRAAGRKAIGFTDTDEPGIYRVATTANERGELQRRPQATFVVNVDPAESDPTHVSPERLAQLKAGGGAHATASAPKRRVELWHALGAALLLLLLGEALLLRRK